MNTIKMKSHKMIARNYTYSDLKRDMYEIKAELFMAEEKVRIQLYGDAADHVQNIFESLFEIVARLTEDFTKQTFTEDRYFSNPFAFKKHEKELAAKYSMSRFRGFAYFLKSKFIEARDRIIRGEDSKYAAHDIHNIYAMAMDVQSDLMYFAKKKSRLRKNRIQKKSTLRKV